MATALTVTPTGRENNTLSLIDADSEGNYFNNTGREILYVQSNWTDPLTLTIETTATVDGQAVADKIFTIPVNGQCVFGPFPVETYNDANQRVNITPESADMKLAVLRV